MTLAQITQLETFPSFITMFAMPHTAYVDEAHALIMTDLSKIDEHQKNHHRGHIKIKRNYLSRSAVETDSAKSIITQYTSKYQLNRSFTHTFMIII